MPDVAIIGSGDAAEALADALGAGERGVHRVAQAEPAIARCAVVFDTAVGTGPGDQRAALSAVLAAAPAPAIVATVLSHGSITAVAAGLDGDRVVGMRVVARAGPPGAVELTSVEGAGRAAADIVAEILAAAGFAVLHTADRPGGLLDALHLPFLNQAVQALDDGLASGQDLELAVELGLGHAVGPLHAVDAWGLADYVGRARALYEETGDRWHAAPAILDRVIDAAPAGGRASLLEEGADS